MQTKRLSKEFRAQAFVEQDQFSVANKYGISPFILQMICVSMKYYIRVCFCVFCPRVAWLFLPTEFVCEKDELADLVGDLKHANVIGSHRRGLTVYKKSFSCDQLVDWLQKEKGMGK